MRGVAFACNIACAAELDRYVWREGGRERYLRLRSRVRERDRDGGGRGRETEGEERGREEGRKGVGQ